MPPFQGSIKPNSPPVPRALPWALLGRPFGAPEGGGRRRCPRALPWAILGRPCGAPEPKQTPARRGPHARTTPAARQGATAAPPRPPRKSAHHGRVGAVPRLERRLRLRPRLPPRPRHHPPDPRHARLGLLVRGDAVGAVPALFRLVLLRVH